MEISIIGSLEEVSADEWNRLAGVDYPFTRHEFLVALERHNCVGEKYGWYPQHILVRDASRKNTVNKKCNGQGQLVGAVPMYLKDNSYGEFVFDWAWAEAYSRSGLNYYPKLVVAIPYTPATGPRLLVENLPENDRSDNSLHENSLHKNSLLKKKEIENLLIRAAIQHAQSTGVSSLHWLFPDDKTTRDLESQGLMRRIDCQFQWTNNAYKSFDDFLSTFSSQKRKKIKRERRRVSETDVEIEVLKGIDISDEQWEIFHYFYQIPFYLKSGTPTLSLGFFMEIGKTMPENIVLMLAKHHDRYVAAAFNFCGKDTLYGRHWGSDKRFHSLHFELCYYRGIDYCIKNGLQRFEPGAQGEHKISRGFLPTTTYSAHWLSHPQFRSAISDFLGHETNAMENYIETLDAHSPYKTQT
ncbi:MAG: N-acetyltransferase [Gammaproteobacteria bacterium]|nr:N-acetyltransferase [Gammaproteobacteria bacterium]